MTSELRLAIDRELRDRERVEVDVRVIGQRIASQGRVFAARQSVGDERRRVVNRREGDDEGRRGGQRAVGDRVGQGRDVAIPIRHWDEAIRTIGIDRDRADTREDGRLAGSLRLAVDREAGDRERAIDVGVVGQDITRDRGVFGGGGGIGEGDGRVIDRGDRERERRGCGLATIGQRVGDDGDVTVPVEHRCEGVGARRGQREATDVGDRVGGTDRERTDFTSDGEGRDSQVGRFDIGVVGEDVTTEDGVFSARARVDGADRRVIDRGEGDGQLGRGGGGTVGDRVGCERYGTIPVGDRREGVSTRGADGERTLAGDGGGLAGRVDRGVAEDRELRHREGGACIDVGVIGQDIASGGVVFGHGDAVVGGDRRVIDGGDRQRERGGRRGDPIGERVGDHRHSAVVVGHRREEVGTVGVDAERALGGDRGGLASGVDRGVTGDQELRHGEDGALNIGVVGQEVTGDVGIFGARRGVGDTDRRVIDRGDGERERRGRRQRAIGGGVGDDRGGAVPVGQRHEDVEAVAADRQAADVRDGEGRADGASDAVDREGRDGHRAIDVGVVRQDVARDRGHVFRGGGGVGDRDRRVVDGRDREREGRGRGGGAVGQRVGDDRHGAVPVGHRREGVGARRGEVECTLTGEGVIRANRERTRFTRDGKGRDCERGVLDVGVVGEDVAGDVRVFSARARVDGADRRVVDRRERDTQGRRRGERAVRDRVGERRDVAVEVGDRDEGVAAVGVDDDRADARDGGRLAGGLGLAVDREARDREGVVDVGVVGQDVARDRGHVFRGGGGVGNRDWCVVHRGDREREGRGRGGGAVGQRVGDDRHGAVPVGHRRERVGTRGRQVERALTGDRVVGADRERTGFTGDGERGDGQDGLLDVGVVGEDVAGLDRVFGARARVGDAHRRVVDRGDRDGEGRGGGQAAVRRGVGDGRDRAVPVGDRDEGVTAVGVQRERTDVGDGEGRADRAGDAVDREGRDRQRAVDVGVVGEDVARDRGGVFQARGRVGDRDRRVVDRGDRERERRGRGGRAVGQRVGDDRDGAVPVGDRREDVGTVGVDLDRALGGDRGRLAGRVGRDVAADRELRHGQGGVLDVGVVGEHVAHQVGVFGARLGVGDAHRRVVDRGDRDGEGRGGGQAAVRRGVGDGRDRAVPVGDRDEGVGARRGQHEAADVGDIEGRADRAGDAIDREGRDREGRGFGVGVVGEDIARDRGHIFSGRGAIRDGDWRVIDGRDRERERGGRGGGAIRQRVGDDWDAAVPVGHRRERPGARGREVERALAGDGVVRADRERTRFTGDGEGRDGQDRLLDVGVVREDVAREVGVFGDRAGVGGADRRVVDRGDRQGERGRGRQRAVGRRVGDGRDDAVPVGGRDEGVGTRRGQREAADIGDGEGRADDTGDAIDREGRDRQRAVDVGVVRQDVTRDRGHIFGRRGGIRNGDWRVVDRGDRQRERRGGGQATIGERVGDDGDGAVVVGDRREDIGAIGVDAEGALRGDRGGRACGVDRDVTRHEELRDGERRLFDVGVVGQDVASDIGVFGARIGVNRADRGVVDRRDGQRERGRGGQATVGRRVGDDRNDAVPVGSRDEGVGTRRGQREAADIGDGEGRADDTGDAIDREGRDRQRAVDVGVVRQDVTRDRGHIFGRRGGIRNGDWRVVDRGDRQRERRGGGQATIGERVGDDGDGAVVVGDRREDIGAIGVDAEGALRGDRGGRACGVDRDVTRHEELRDGERRLFDVGVVGQDVASDIGVFGARIGVNRADRGVVDRRDGQRERGRGGQATVGRRVGDDRNDAVPVGSRDEGVGTRRGQREAADIGDGEGRADGASDAVDREGRDRERAVDVGVVGEDITRDRGHVFGGRSGVGRGNRRVIDGRDRERERRRRGGRAIRQRVGDDRDAAVEVGDRREDVGTIGVDRDRTLGSDRRGLAGGVDRHVAVDRELRHGEGGLLDVRVVGQDVAGDVRILSARVGLSDADRGVVDRGHRDGQGRRGGQAAIGRGVGDGRDGAVPVGGRDEGVRTRRGQREAADIGDREGRADRAGDAVHREAGDREAGAFGVGVVGEDVARDRGGVFGARSGVGVGDRRVIDRGDGERERRGAGESTVGQRVGDDRDRAIEVGDRREDVGTIGVDADGALGGDRGRLAGGVDRHVTADRELGYGQGIAFGVRVVGQDVAGDVRVFRTRVGLDRADRRVVDGGDRDRELGRVGQRAIGQRVGGDRDGAVPVAGRREGVSAVRVDRQGTLTGDGGRLAGGLRLAVDRELRDRQRIAVEVGVVGQDITRSGHVFVGCSRVVRADRRVIDGRDRERERRRRGGRAIRQRVGDDRDAAVEVGDRREDVGTIGVDADGALRGDRGGGAGRVDRDVTVDRELGHRQRGIFDVGVVRQDVADDIGVFGTRARVGDTDRGVVDGVDGEG